MRVFFNVFLIILTLCMDSVIIRFYFDYDDKKERKRFTGSIYIFTILSALLLCGLIDLFKTEIFGGLFKDIPLNPHFRIVIWTTFFAISLRLISAYFRAARQTIKASLLEITRAALIAVGAIIFLVVLRRGTVGKLQGDFAAYFLCFLISTILFFKIATPAFNLSYIKEAVRFGLPLIPLALSLWIMGFIDRIMLQYYRNAAEVGFYSLGYNIGIILALSNIAIVRAWRPYFYETATKGVNKEKISKLMLNIFSFMLLIGICLTVFSKVLISFVSPPEYIYSATIVPLIITGYVMFSLFNLFSTQIGYAKKPHYLTKISLFCVAINIGLNILLIPSFGMHGAAVATVITFIFLALFTFIYAQKAYALPYNMKIFLIFILWFQLFLFIYTLLDIENSTSQILSGILLLLLFAVPILKAGYLNFKLD